jgi:hypothetical protein
MTHEEEMKRAFYGRGAEHDVAPSLPKAAPPQPDHSAQLAALSLALVMETERAIRQRDEFLRTGVSTASQGGSHDTCFPAIIRKHVLPLIQAQPFNMVQGGVQPFKKPDRAKWYDDNTDQRKAEIDG